MSEVQAIEASLKATASRRRWARALHGLWRGLLWGAIVSLVLSAAHHLLPLPDSVRFGVILAPVVTGIIGLIAGAWRREKLHVTARWVDVQENLKERLGTALELQAKPDAGAWRNLVISDAAQHAGKINPGKLVRFSLSRAARWALVVLIVVAGLGFVPEYRSQNYLRKKADEQNIQQVGRQLADLTKRSLDKRQPLLEPAQKAMEAVVETGNRLANSQLTRGDALKELASVADKLKQEMNSIQNDPAIKRMDQAARASSGGNPQNAAAIQRQIEEAQKQLGTPVADPALLDKMQKQLEQLRSSAAQTGANSQSSAEDRQKLSAALSALSQQAMDMGLQLPQLDDAINALAAANTDAFLKDMNQAVNDLQKMRDMAKSLQQLQQQMEKLGKDLAEQLENGQPEAAQMTLKKMIERLAQQDLQQSDLSSILQDVSKAVSPAAGYGDVSKHLKAAASKMNSGDKKGSSEDLAKAADELGKLMQQMANSDTLSAEMDALNQASMCIASGNCWGMGQGRPAAGKGGSVGSGVGTWATDESREWNGEMTDRWDNSGLVRPDQDPRGVSERDPNLNEALKPTKVKGQFSQGNQMPSITLRGVSIKGQSTVDYEASATAAQSEAESALTQEKVPRAYQGAVKDYFDDLKK